MAELLFEFFQTGDVEAPFHTTLKNMHHQPSMSLAVETIKEQPWCRQQSYSQSHTANYFEISNSMFVLEVKLME